MTYGYKSYELFAVKGHVRGSQGSKMLNVCNLLLASPFTYLVGFPPNLITSMGRLLPKKVWIV